MTSSPQTWRPPQSIRPLSIGLIQRPEELLVMAVRNDAGGIKGWRPPGGGIEFGESAQQAVVREIMEELGQPVACGRQVCVLENIFMHEGHPGHEVVFVFEVEFSDPSAYSIEKYSFIDQGIANVLAWRKVSDLVEGSEPLFPDSLCRHL